MLLLGWMLITGNLQAQSLTVLHRDTEAPLEGVHLITEAGDTLISDATGHIPWTVPPGQQVRLEHPGFKPLVLDQELAARLHFIILMEPASIELGMVLVTAYDEHPNRSTSLQITPVTLRQLSQTGAFNLADGLASVPGISQLSTGPAISKPVIRGLYGNRVLVLFSGLRFDNQQWQDEHGLGLQDMGIDRVEVIKGPLSLLYGTEAVGGVLNIVEEEAPDQGAGAADWKGNLHSNTLGGGVEGGWKSWLTDSTWCRVRMGVQSHADYTDGDGNRVLNSRADGVQAKLSYGIRKKHFSSDNHYYGSYNRFGFIFADLPYRMETDERWSRGYSGPHHMVMLHSLSSVNKFDLHASTLRINAGVQSNYRAEDEGGGELSLQMHLATFQYALKWNKPITEKWLFILANNSSWEVNTNLGRRKIVPDALMAEASSSGYIRYMEQHWLVEAGIGGGSRQITTLLTPTVNSDEKDIDPFSQLRLFGNMMLGFSWMPDAMQELKLDVATGVRAPNLAELSSNGLHEGTYTYELGDPELLNERNIQADAGYHLHTDVLDLELAAFVNHFSGYIYLQPADYEWFGFPVAEFVQAPALLYGGEAGISKAWQQWTFGLSGQMLVGRLDDGTYLPYMPANAVEPSIRYESRSAGAFRFFGSVKDRYVFAQELINPAETNTPGYHLVQASAGLSRVKGETGWELQLVANNLLDVLYYDHMSRLKYYDIYNMGRDVSLQFIYHLYKTNKNN